MKNVFMLVCVIVVLVAAVQMSMRTSDCNYAWATLETLEANSQQFTSTEDYLAAKRPHQKFLLEHCK